MSELRFVAPDLRQLDEASAEIVACGVWRDGRPLSGLAGLVDWRLAGRLSRLAKQSFLLGEVGEVLVMPARPRLTFDKVLAFGLGPRAAFGEPTYQKVTERVLDAISGLAIKKAAIELPGRGDDAIAAERAADLLLDVLGDDDREALTLIETTEGQQKIEAHAQDRRRTSMRARG